MTSALPTSTWRDMTGATLLPFQIFYMIVSLDFKIFHPTNIFFPGPISRGSPSAQGEKERPKKWKLKTETKNQLITKNQKRTKNQLRIENQKPTQLLFIQPRWLKVRSMGLVLSHWLQELCWDLTDVTLVDEDTNSIQNGNANKKAIQGAVAMHVATSGGQFCN